MFIAIAALSVLLGVVAYYATDGAFSAGTQSSSTPSASQVPRATPLRSLFDLRAGQCANSFFHTTKLNAPELQQVSCDTPAARVQLQFITLDGGSRPCNTADFEYKRDGDELYCFQLPVKQGYCYPAWLGDENGGAHTSTAFYLPHACDETFTVTDDDLPKPTTWNGATNIHRVDIRILAVRPTASETACDNGAYSFKVSDDTTVCGEVVG
ncbi:hypothetical protein [Mycolicibacterium llatzerense]|uniref:hypothetical protein n=1 Tax=Mycolicibacterium llatzerense TaxID=280871 RepID=UPI0008DE451B|nr:hypothetical protein [Mycolicibacterium llatzerense]